jgi:Winged helix-turn-helix DNA-binding
MLTRAAASAPVSKILAASAGRAAGQPRAVVAVTVWQGSCYAGSRAEEIVMSEPQDWWDTLDADTLRCLTENGPMSPAELGKQLGISEDGAASLVSHLAREGKVRICLVESAT